MKYISLIGILIVINSCFRKPCEATLIKEINEKFEINFFRRMDTLPDTVHLKQISEARLSYLKAGYDKQFFRVWVFEERYGLMFIEVYINAEGIINGAVTHSKRWGDVSKKILAEKEKLCSLNNLFIKNQFNVFQDESYYYHRYNYKVRPFKSDCFFHFEYASKRKYKNVFFANPYLRYKNGMKEAAEPMRILDAIYEYIDDKEIRRVIDEARRQENDR
jgi:hypothetical protein